MAIIDLTKKPYINDRDDNVFIGIDLPFRKSTGVEGYFASTDNTIDAVKNNISNLLRTNQGERLYRPTFGTNLHSFLFEQITDELQLIIRDELTSTIKFWLPFVSILSLNIVVGKNNDANVFNIEMQFKINKDPNTLNSINVTV